MRTLAMILGLAALSGACLADTVEMKETGLKLEGKILRETDEFIIILVHNDQGQIRIPRNKIKTIEYDIKTQLEKIKEDDYAGRYKVAQWAMDKGMLAEAVEVMEALDGKEGVPTERLKLLGQAYEKREQLDKALEKYSDYLKAHPEDKEVNDRVEALVKLVNPNGNTPGADPKTKIVDGLEGDGAWVAENWGNAAKASIVSDPATGNKTVAIAAEAGDKDKTAVTRTGQPLNLADSKEMVFKVFFNSQAQASMGVAFINSNNEFFEGRPTKLVPNSWNTISVKIDGKDFKAQKSNWQHSLELEGKERMSRIVFLVYGQRQFTMHIDSVFFK